MITQDTALARELVDDARRVVVLTGAGISTAAGIPDFRGPQGLWTRDPMAEQISDLHHYLHDDQVRVAAWRRRAEQAAWQTAPTAAHRALAAWERTGRLAAVITQNTDSLHWAAGSTLVHEVHGAARTTRCERCGYEQPTAAVAERVTAGEDDPRCLVVRGTGQCGGILRATVVLFGELLDRTVLDACVHVVEDCDLLVAIGTTLAVQPVAGLFPHAVASGARTLIINGSATEYDDLAHVTLRADIEQVVPELFTLSPAPPQSKVGE